MNVKDKFFLLKNLPLLAQFVLCYLFWFKRYKCIVPFSTPSLSSNANKRSKVATKYQGRIFFAFKIAVSLTSCSSSFRFGNKRVKITMSCHKIKCCLKPLYCFVLGIERHYISTRYFKEKSYLNCMKECINTIMEIVLKYGMSSFLTKNVL